MADEALERGTGKPILEWRSIIVGAGLGDADHKKIAAYLHDEHDVSFWWAQEITVEYERAIGRRVPGQTQDGRFQTGVSRTVGCRADRLWQIVTSDAFIDALLAEEPSPGLDDGRAATGRDEARLAGLQAPGGRGRVEAKTTTFERGSHVRMRWRLPAWPDHSILQIRVTPKAGDKSTLTFHHERLPSNDARERMRTRWKSLAAATAAAAKGE